MSKILKSVTLGDVKNGGIFRALGKEFVKLDADAVRVINSNDRMRTNTAALYWQRKFGRECRSVKVTTQNAPTICAGARLCHIWVTAWQSLQRTALR